MRPVDIPLVNDITVKLNSFQQIIPMPGINNAVVKDCLVKQMVDSIRRIKYIDTILKRNWSSAVCDPNNIAFDPIKAAAWNIRNQNLDEASWLVFLATHFGKNLRTKWQLVANVYGALNQQANWTWNNTTADVNGFRNWLHQNAASIKANGKFGNHRKYETINGLSQNGTGEAVETYINWVVAAGGHSNLFNNVIVNSNGPKEAFALLYNQMNTVARFGRTAKFDYLTMIGKLGIAAIEPDSTYMHGSTGPYAGATLLFGNKQPQATFNQWLDSLENHLGLYFGMQVLEDSLCNWQKSPQSYRYFGG